MKIHFLKNLLQFVDYLCSLGDEGINILRNDILIKHIGEIISSLDKNELSFWLLEYYKESVTAIIYCFISENWDKLNKIYSSLCNKKDPTIRRSIIAYFHEVSNIVGWKITEKELLIIYENFLSSKDTFEKNFVIKIYKKFWQLLVKS